MQTYTVVCMHVMISCDAVGLLLWLIVTRTCYAAVLPTGDSDVPNRPMPAVNAVEGHTPASGEVSSERPAKRRRCSGIIGSDITAIENEIPTIEASAGYRSAGSTKSLSAALSLSPRKWWCTCVALWLVVLCAQAPLLIPAFTTQPVVIVRAQLTLAAMTYRYILGSMLGSSFIADFPSIQFRRSRFQQVALVHIRDPSAITLRRLTLPVALMASYAFTRRRELVQSNWSKVWSLLEALMLTHQFYKILTQQYPALHYWKSIWRISPMPAHRGDLDPRDWLRDSQEPLCESECSLHDDCAICLDKLCTSVRALALSAMFRKRRAAPAFSAARLRLSGTATGLSAVRCHGLQMCQETVTGMWAHIATAGCGHKTHLGCIEKSAKVQTLCPACRRSFGGDWSEMRPEWRSLVQSGLVVVAVVYFFAQAVTWWCGLWQGQLVQ